MDEKALRLDESSTELLTCLRKYRSQQIAESNSASAGAGNGGVRSKAERVQEWGLLIVVTATFLITLATFILHIVTSFVPWTTIESADGEHRAKVNVFSVKFDNAKGTSSIDAFASPKEVFASRTLFVVTALMLAYMLGSTVYLWRAKNRWSVAFASAAVIALSVAFGVMMKKVGSDLSSNHVEGVLSKSGGAIQHEEEGVRLTWAQIGLSTAAASLVFIQGMWLWNSKVGRRIANELSRRHLGGVEM